MFFGNHPIEFGYFVGTVLQIGVHGDDDITGGLFKPDEEGGGLAVIPAELDSFYRVGVLLFQRLDYLPGGVGTAVVDEQDFVREVVFFHHPGDPLGKFG